MKRKNKKKIDARYKEASKHAIYAIDNSPKAIVNYKTYYATPRFTRRNKKS